METPEEGEETIPEEQPQEIEEREEKEEAQPEAAKEPRQVVTIKTPLDRPEFDFFIDNFMKRLGLTDRKQTAIKLTQMFYEMGLDPYEDLDDMVKEMERMNRLLKNLPDTPAAKQVKDTIGGVMAAKAGREMIDKMPSISEPKDELTARFEKVMDRYMPLVMSMRMMSEMMRGETSEKKEVPESLKAELDKIREQLSKLQSSQKEEEIPAWAQGLQAEMEQIHQRLEKDEAEKRRSEEDVKRHEELQSVVEPIRGELVKEREERQRLAEKMENQREPQLPPKSAVEELVEHKKQLEELGIIKEPTIEGLPPETHIASKTIDKGEHIVTKAMDDMQETVSQVLEYQLEREKRMTQQQTPKLPKLTPEEKLATLQEAAGEPAGKG